MIMANIKIPEFPSEEKVAFVKSEQLFWAAVEEVENKPLGTWTMNDWYLLEMAY